MALWEVVVVKGKTTRRFGPYQERFVPDKVKWVEERFTPDEWVVTVEPYWGSPEATGDSRAYAKYTSINTSAKRGNGMRAAKRGKR